MKSKTSGLSVRSAVWANQLSAQARLLAKYESLDERFFPQSNFAEVARQKLKTGLSSTGLQNAADAFQKRATGEPSSNWERVQIIRAIKDRREAREG